MYLPNRLDFSVLLVLLLGLTLALTCTAEPVLEIRNARVTELIPGQYAAAGYLELHNPGEQPIEVVGVSSPAFAEVQLHETANENGLMTMRRHSVLSVAAGETVALQPGGYHLMLVDPVEVDSPQPRVELRLVTADGATYAVEALVVRAGDAGASSAHQH